MNKFFTPLRSLAIVLVLAAVGVGMWFAFRGAGRPSDEVVVGSLLALSGPDKSFGVTQQRGMEIALDEVNAAGGINGRRLRVEFADTKLQDDLGLQEYKRLTGEAGVPAIVGITGSGVNLRICPFANKDHVVLLDSLATSPKLTQEGGPYFFRTIASDAFSGVVLSKWAVGRGHKRAALVFNSENAWARGLRSAVEESYPKEGGTWAAQPVSVLNSTDNFSSAIIAIRQASPPPDAVFVCLMGRQAGLFVAQAKANNLNVTFYGTDTFSQQEFLDNAKDGLGQSFFVLPAEEKTDRYKAFEAEFRKRYQAEADSIAAKAYDSAHVLAVALRDADKSGPLTGERIRDALARVHYDGITGPIAFDEHGDLKEPRFDRFTYQDGKRVVVP